MLLPNRFSFGGEPSSESDHLQQRGVATHSFSRSDVSKPDRTGAVLLAIIVFLLSRSSPALAQSGSPGLVAAHSFDEGTGNSVADLSGNNINGTVVGATWIVKRNVRQCSCFQGDHQLR